MQSGDGDATCTSADAVEGVVMGVFDAVERELETLGLKAAQSTMAATALALAQELDGRSSATSKSMCAKALVEVMREVRALAPPEKENDGLDDLAARRAARLAGGAASADSSRP